MNYDERVKVTPVYFDRGKFYTMDDAKETNVPKFARAPFDIVQFERTEGGAVDQFVRPRSNIRLGDPNLWGTLNTAHEDEGFGFLTGEHIVIGEHEMGADTVDGPFSCFFMKYLTT